VMGIPSDRQFLGLVGKVLPGFFPELPDQSQYNRRLRKAIKTKGDTSRTRRPPGN
jgi:hypothetical protein